MAGKKSLKPIKEKSTEENNKYFQVSLDTFLYNAGIIGFIQILEEAGAKKGENKEEVMNNKKDYYYEGQDLFVSKKFLKSVDLGNIFIKTVCDKFEKETFIYQVKDKNTKEKTINEAIKQCKNNKGKYSMAFDMINSLKEKNYKELFIEDTEKTINKILKDEDILNIVNFYSIYKHFSVFIGNFAFLDSPNISQGLKKGEKIYLQNILNNIFVEPIKNLANNNEYSEDKCFICKVDMNKESGYKTKSGLKRHNLTFMNNLGVNVNEKSSAYWNFNADIYVCPLCAYIYICSLLGFTQIDNSFVFINENNNIDSLIGMKSALETSVDSENKKCSILNITIEKMLKIKKYEIDSIQVIVKNLDLDRYNINTIDKNIIKIVNECGDRLAKLALSFKKINNTTINIFDECLNNIINSTEQYNLIFNLIKAEHNIYDIYRLLKIQIIQKNIFDKETNMKDKIKKAYVACEKGDEMKKSIDESKINSLVYKLINALHTSNKNLFLDTITRLYNGMNLDIPSIFLQMFTSDNDFKEIGYAYVLGLKGAYYNKKENKEEGENNGK